MIIVWATGVGVGWFVDVEGVSVLLVVESERTNSATSTMIRLEIRARVFLESIPSRIALSIYYPLLFVNPDFTGVKVDFDEAKSLE